MPNEIAEGVLIEQNDLSRRRQVDQGLDAIGITKPLDVVSKGRVTQNLASKLHDIFRARYRNAQGTEITARWVSIPFEDSDWKNKPQKKYLEGVYRKNPKTGEDEVDFAKATFDQLPVSLQSQQILFATALINHAYKYAIQYGQVPRDHKAQIIDNDFPGDAYLAWVNNNSWVDAKSDDPTEESLRQQERVRSIPPFGPKANISQVEIGRDQVAVAVACYVEEINAQASNTLDETRRKEAQRLEIRERLKDPKYLPKKSEVEAAFDFEVRMRGNKPTTDFTDFLEGVYQNVGPYGVSEYPTQEYINGLCNHLEKRIIALGGGVNGKKVNILEVAAGNGRLAFFIDKRLKEMGMGDKYAFKAVDIKEPLDKNLFDVQQADYLDALKDEDHKPEIVIGAWLPDKRENEYRSDYVEEDWSRAIRQTSSVQEYILIGDPKEHALPSTFGQHERSRKQMMSQRRAEYWREGFNKPNTLEHLKDSQFCYADRADDMHRSRTISFTRR